PSSALEVGDKDGERLRRLLDGKTLGAVAVFPPLSAQPTGRILARTALPTTVLASLRRYRVELEGETLPAIAAFLDLEWSGGKGRLGVAVAQSGAVFGP